MRMMLVPRDFDVFIGEFVDVKNLVIQAELRKIKRFPADLQPGLFKMVEVQMGVPKGVNKHTGFEPAHLRHHVGEKGVGSNVERHAEEDIGASLVELTIQSSL